jgi:hypothetical protein
MDYVEGSHDGYTRLPRPVVHRRGVLFMKPDYWILRDELTGEGTHQIDRYFHLAPDFDPTVTGSRVCARHAAGIGLLIIAFEADGVRTEVWSEGERPEDGWIATGYGQKHRAPTFCFRTRIIGPAVLHTLLVPFRGTAPTVEVTPLVDGSYDGFFNQGFIIRYGSVNDTVLFAGSDRRLVSMHSIATDARVAGVRHGSSGEVTACAMVDGSMLAADDQVLLHAIRRVQFAASTQRGSDDVIECSDPAETLTSRTVQSRALVGV